MPRRVGFSDEKSMPLAHVTLAPIMGLNNHDEGTSTDPARVHRPARPRGHTASLPPCWTPVSSQPVVPTSGKVSPLSSQEMQTVLASLLFSEAGFHSGAYHLSGLYFPTVCSGPRIYVLKYACDHHNLTPVTSPSYYD